MCLSPRNLFWDHFIFVAKDLFDVNLNTETFPLRLLACFSIAQEIIQLYDPLLETFGSPEKLDNRCYLCLVLDAFKVTETLVKFSVFSCTTFAKQGPMKEDTSSK